MSTKLKLSIKWALIFSLASLLWISIAKPIGLYGQYIDKFPNYSMLFFIPALIIWYKALIDIRINAYGNSLSYKDAFWAGIIITILVTALTPIVQVVFHKLVAPNFFTIMIKASIEKGGSTKVEAEKLFNLNAYIIQTFIASLLSGIIISAIIAVFVKNK